MKTFWSWSAKILLVVVIIQAWFLYDLQIKNRVLIGENVELESQLLKTEEELAAATEEVADLERRSLEGVLRETNKAVVSGWEMLLDTVQDELEKAKEAFPGLLNGDESTVDPASPSEAKPNPSEQTVTEDSDDETADEVKQAESPETDTPQEPQPPVTIEGERT